MRVEKIMLSLEEIPVIADTDILKVAIQGMTNHRLGIACIVDSLGVLKAVVTDGDIRRMLLRVQKPAAALMADEALSHATTSLVTVTPDSELLDAVAVMGEYQIWDLPVTERDGRLVGVLHLHPAVTKLLQN